LNIGLKKPPLPSRERREVRGTKLSQFTPTLALPLEGEGIIGKISNIFG
jgi:hypothetical protein